MPLRGGGWRAAFSREALPGWLLLLGPWAVAMLLGVHRIGERSIWLDESASIFVAEAAPEDFFRVLGGSKLNMSLYFALLRPWTALGSGEGVVRLLGVLFAAATVPLLYLLVRRFFDRFVAASAALALAMHSFFIEWAQQARGYGLAMLLSTVATYAFVRVLQGGGLAWAVVYGVAAGLGLYVHVFVGLVLVAHAAAVLVAWRRRRILELVAIGWLLAGIVGVPLLGSVLVGRGAGLEWISPLTLNSLRVALRNLSGGGWALWLYAVGVVAAIGTWAVWQRRGDERRHGLLLLGLWALLPAALTVAISLVKPLLVPRYLLVSLPALAAIVVIGLVGLQPSRWTRLATVVAVLLITITTLPSHYDGEDRTDYRGLTAAVGRNAQPGDGIAWWTPSHARPSVYYVRRLGLEGMPEPVGTAVSWEGNPYAREAVSTWPSACLPPRVWLVDGPRNLEGRPYPGRRGQLVALLADYETSGGASRFGNLKLRIFELGDGAPLPACSH